MDQHTCALRALHCEPVLWRASCVSLQHAFMRLIVSVGRTLLHGCKDNQHLQCITLWHCQQATYEIEWQLAASYVWWSKLQILSATFCSLQRRLSSAKRPADRAPRHNLPVTVDGHGNQVIEVEPGVTAPADAVLGTADNKPMSAPGCLSLFNSAAASNKYFVRTSKPAAGSSLNVSQLHA